MLYYFREKLYTYTIYIIHFCQLQFKNYDYAHTYFNFYKSRKWSKRSSLTSFSKPPAPPACTVSRIRRERDLSTTVVNAEKNIIF